MSPLRKMALGFARWSVKARVLFVWFGLSAEFAVAAPLEKVTSYEIDVRLDELQHQISGEETIRFTNTSTEPLAGIYFHLYLNAFKNDRTLFQRGPSGGGRSGGSSGRAGEVRIESLIWQEHGSQELVGDLAAHTEGDPEDETDIYLPLPDALAPGETAHFRLKFVSVLPEIVERTGYSDDYHFAGQWFPKLAKLEPDGTFAHFAFHPYAEFYADFGDYEVNLDLPLSHVVGATGDVEKLRAEADRAHYRAKAFHVHDFAWVSWPGFREEIRDLSGKKVRFLAPADADGLVEPTWKALEIGLKGLEQRYGSYPYGTLTVVSPPRGAGRSGGMEYPTLITTGGSEWMGRLGLRTFELVTLHELAHQWFQGMIASNEARAPFLDEGFTSYAEVQLLEDAFAPGSLINTPWFKVSRSALLRYAGHRAPPEEPIGQAAASFSSFFALASQVYGRTPLALESLRRSYSMEAFDSAFQSYAKQERFRHPTPQTFLTFMEGALGPKLREQLEILLMSGGRVDYKISSLTETGRAQTEREFRAVVHCSGNVSLPIEIAFRFEDGSEQIRRIESPAAVEVITVRHTVGLDEAHLDPAYRIPLDENLFNNRLSISRSPKERLSHRASVLARLLVRWIGP